MQDQDTAIDRRQVLLASLSVVALPGAFLPALGCARPADAPADTSKAVDGHASEHDKTDPSPPTSQAVNPMKIHYLEIVTGNVDEVCAAYEQTYGVTFGAADVNLGGARTTKIAGDGLLGVRAPLRDDEDPVVRPYLLVKDIEKAVAAMRDSGAEVALPPMEIAGHGTCAIVFHGGIEHGLWQL